jgi:hypothetical protein
VQAGDGCETIEAAAAINSTILLLNNPNVAGDCSNIYVGEVGDLFFSSQPVAEHRLIVMHRCSALPLPRFTSTFDSGPEIVLVPLCRGFHMTSACCLAGFVCRNCEGRSENWDVELLPARRPGVTPPSPSSSTSSLRTSICYTPTLTQSNASLIPAEYTRLGSVELPWRKKPIVGRVHIASRMDP